MYDIEQIRARCRSLPVEELIQEALLNADDYLPEPQQVMREELEARIGDIQGDLKEEREATGEEFARIDGIKNFGCTTNRFVGRLVLTSKGMGFVPSDRDREGIPSPFVHGVIAGLVVSWMQEGLDKATNAGAGQHEAIPLSLLARLYDEQAFWFPLEGLAEIQIDGQVVTIRPAEEREVWGLIDEPGWKVIEDWANQTGATVTRKVRTSLWATISRWFGGGKPADRG